MATGAAGKPIPVGQQPDALAAAPDGKTRYVANYTSNTVTPIATATGAPGKPIAIGDGPTVQA